MAILDTGDRAPPLCGAFTAGGFFSVETYVGQTLFLMAADPTPLAVQLQWAATFRAASAAIEAEEAAFVMLLSMGAAAMSAHISQPEAGVAIAQPSANLADFGGRTTAPDILVIDRAGRVAEAVRLDDPQAALAAALTAAKRLKAPPGQRRFSAAPVLIVPNLIHPDLRRALIDAFEAGDHKDGVMASVDSQGRPFAKLQEDKKRRRDLELIPGHPLYGRVVAALSERLVPEMRRAYHIEVAHADRILIARYDDTGGYFHRHRDNGAPHVAFRQFAVSLNLNTGEYEGGDLEFPEFDNDRYSPPAGAAVVFSASLLHAACPVTRGRRYVLLTFLHDASAEIRRVAHERQSA